MNIDTIVVLDIIQKHPRRTSANPPFALLSKKGYVVFKLFETSVREEEASERNEQSLNAFLYRACLTLSLSICQRISPLGMKSAEGLWWDLI